MTSIRRYPDSWGPPHPVYIAEKAALPFGEPFYNLDHVSDYVSDLLSTEWWRDTFPKIKWVMVHESDGKKYAWAGGEQDLHLPPFAMNEAYLLHELAHLATDSWFPHDECLHHGGEFRTIFCYILYHTMGEWVSNNMEAWYARMGSPVDPELWGSLSEV